MTGYERQFFARDLAAQRLADAERERIARMARAQRMAGYRAAGRFSGTLNPTVWPAVRRLATSMRAPWRRGAGRASATRGA
jgi:hypothetical protein